MDKVFFVVSVLMLIIGIAVLVTTYLNHIKIMKRLKKMLDDAVSGNFSETEFDETAISSLETSMKHYISKLELNKTELSVEKDKVKELISDISHQTKTPAANIILYANLLAESCSDEQKAAVNEIVHQSEKLNMLIQALVKASRLETGIISVVPSENLVKKLIEDSVSVIVPKADNKSISVHISSENAYASFDMKWTSEAVINILDNAVKYAYNDTSINVSVTEYEMFVRIDIENEGITISADEQPKIFQRFYRSPMVHDIEGIGIGLYLAIEIISAEGGYIKVSSGSKNVFSVFLPKK